MIYEALLFLLSLVFLFIIDEVSKHIRIDLPRAGASPGPFNILKWWARWHWSRHGHDDVKQAYAQPSVTNYVIQTLMGDHIVLDPKLLHEVNMLPEAKLSSTAILIDSTLAQYIAVDHLLKDHLASDICRGTFTRNLVNFVPLMDEELKTAMSDELDVEGSRTVVAYDLLFSFVQRITSVVFVGKTHGRTPTWNDAVSTLPQNVFYTALVLLPFPTFLRPLIAPLSPQRARIFRERKAVRNMLFPPSKSLDEMAGQDVEPSVMKLVLESGRDKNPESITARLMILTGAAFHTSSMALAHTVFDLCSRPEYMEPLRLEAQTALAEDEGEWKLSTIKKLRRLDSFLKESQRMNQNLFLGFKRKVLSPVTLSDGTVLPRGSVITMPGGPMSRDPAFYDEPNRFDGLRFYRAGDDSVPASTNSARDFVSIEPGSLAWGSGRFTCPGRWYAAVMIKLILAKLLLEYDVSFPPGQTERPKNLTHDTDVYPEFGQKIVLRKRTAI